MTGSAVAHGNSLSCRPSRYFVLPALFGLYCISLPAQAQFCPVTTDIPLRPVVSEPLAVDDLYLTADRAESVEGGTSKLIGDAELAHNQQQLTADRMDYHQPTEMVDLHGEVHYWDDAVYLNSIDGHVELQSENAAFDNVRYWLLDNRGRGHADSIEVTSGTYTEGRRVDYTTCDPDTDGPFNLTTNIWKLSMSRLFLNHETDRGSGRHVILKVKDIPVFYTPYLSFPISGDRKSGFLFPGFGSSTRNGAELQIPWYWNIAPQMDATITPRLMSNVGAMLAGQYRYLMRRGEGMLEAEYLPADKRFDNESRGSIAFEHEQRFLDNGRLKLLYNRVSDQQYLEHFSSSLLGTSTRFLEQSAYAAYGWNLNGHYLALSNTVSNYQTVDRTLPVAARPYKRLPSTLLTYASPYQNRKLNYNLSGRFDYFTRGDDPTLDSVNGIRYDISPTVSLPLNTLSWFVVPKAGFHFTRYAIDDNNTFADNSPERALPFVSLDSGLLLERNTRLFGESVIQTLEPRAYYLYVPRENQNDLPVFDTGQFRTTFDSLFYENRFNGTDRFGDANQLTLAATSRFYEEASGQYLGYFSLGQTYYLRDWSVALPRYTLRGDDYSVIVSEFGATPFDGLELRAELQWDPKLESTRKLSFSAMYQPTPDKVINLGYRDIESETSRNALAVLESVEQTDISFRWPVKPGISLVGKWNYAIKEKRSLDLFAGVEYNSCCWGVRVVARRFLSNIDGEFESGVFLQFELKGLAGMGEKTVDFLRNSIPGYQNEF